MNGFFAKAREPINSFTHFLGALFAVISGAFLVVLTCTQGRFSPVTLSSVVIFGVSMLLLYTASSWYHYSNAPQAVLSRLRKLDHAMIYVLIAGSYTPICLKFMQPQEGIVFCAVLWSVALVGSLIKVFWMNAPRWLSTSFYLMMGWSIMLDWDAFSALPSRAVALLFAEGISYSLGALCYILKKPNLSPSLGFHEIFHLFILLGTFFHFLCVWLYVVL